MIRFSREKLADAVRSRRKALKMTQAQLSSAAGINRSLLSNLENGTFVPDLAQLDRIAQAYRIQSNRHGEGVKIIEN